MDGGGDKPLNGPPMNQSDRCAGAKFDWKKMGILGMRMNHR